MKAAPMPKYELQVKYPVYSPDEDSFLLMDAIYNRKPDFAPTCVAEVGCGYGCAAALLGKMYELNPVLLDTNELALECASRTMELNGIKAEVFQSDLLEAVAHRSDIDIICFNPPYVPGELRTGDLMDTALCGGMQGREVIDRFLDELTIYWRSKERCCLYLICIEKNHIEIIMSRLEELFDTVECVATKQLSTEKLYALFCQRNG